MFDAGKQTTLRLSRDGVNAVVIRKFDLADKRLIEGGLFLSDALLCATTRPCWCRPHSAVSPSRPRQATAAARSFRPPTNEQPAREAGCAAGQRPQPLRRLSGLLPGMGTCECSRASLE